LTSGVLDGRWETAEGTFSRSVYKMVFLEVRIRAPQINSTTTLKMVILVSLIDTASFKQIFLNCCNTTIKVKFTL
jgi:hypothetical protein